MFYPDFESFQQLTAQGNLIPVTLELTADFTTVIAAFENLAYKPDGSREKYAFLLESVEEGRQLSRYSFIGVNPNAVIVQQESGQAVLTQDGQSEVLDGPDLFHKIENYLQRFKPVKLEGLPPFSGGAVGFNSFEVIHEIEPSVKPPEKSDLNTPEAVFMIIDTLVAFDHVRNRLQLITHALVDDQTDLQAAYTSATEKLKALTETLRRPVRQPLQVMPRDIEPIDMASNKTESEFHQMVEKVKDYIYDGDLIQAVISQRFEADCKLSPLAIHRALRLINPSPYMFCLHLDDLALVGSSPEVHARCIDEQLEVRPIAGTRRRGRTEADDLAMEQDLMNDEKELAEHIMLVDLGRNDLGRIAEKGSVKVPHLMRIERYSHVMHIVSNVTAKLTPGQTPASVMSATFPAGTLSGAPKIRAMQIISELEQTKRGPYGGTIVYFSFGGNIDSCITIRTVMLKDQKAYIQAGAGIVADSQPELEFKETLNKSAGMRKALALAEYLDCPAG